jgi:hypothetical protein
VAHRLAQTTALLRGAHQRGDHVAFRDLARLEADLAGRLAAMSPPAAADPEADPRYVGAKDRLRRSLDRLLAARDEKAAVVAAQCCDSCRAIVATFLGVTLTADGVSL